MSLFWLKGNRLLLINHNYIVINLIHDIRTESNTSGIVEYEHPGAGGEGAGAVGGDSGA